MNEKSSSNERTPDDEFAFERLGVIVRRIVEKVRNRED